MRANVRFSATHPPRRTWPPVAQVFVPPFLRAYVPASRPFVTSSLRRFVATLSRCYLVTLSRFYVVALLRRHRPFPQSLNPSIPSHVFPPSHASNAPACPHLPQLSATVSKPPHTRLILLILFAPRPRHPAHYRTTATLLDHLPAPAAPPTAHHGESPAAKRRVAHSDAADRRRPAATTPSEQDGDRHRCAEPGLSVAESGGKDAGNSCIMAGWEGSRFKGGGGGREPRVGARLRLPRVLPNLRGERCQTP